MTENVISRPIPLCQRLTVTAQEFAVLTGTSDTQVSEWLNDPTFPAFRREYKKYVRVQIPVKAAEAWLTQKAKNRENMPRPMKRII